MSAIYDATHHEPSTSPSHRLHLLTAVADRLEIRPPRECLIQPIVSTGSSTQGTKTVLHPVFDLATAKAVYAALFGGPPQTDSSYNVGFEAAGQHIRPVPGGGSHGIPSPAPDGNVLGLLQDR
jgi:hypothetical protein